MPVNYQFVCSGGGQFGPAGLASREPRRRAETSAASLRQPLVLFFDRTPTLVFAILTFGASSIRLARPAILSSFVRTSASPLEAAPSHPRSAICVQRARRAGREHWSLGGAVS